MKGRAILSSCCEQAAGQQETYDAYRIFFGTLVSESRLKILNMLRKGEKNVTELADELDMEQTALSHDLKRLKHCGFVTVRPEGKYRYYTLNEETIRPILETIEEHMSKHCIHILRKQERRETS